MSQTLDKITKMHSITVSKARSILGKDGDNYSDDQLQQILNTLYSVASVAYYDLKKPSKKK